MTRADRIAGCLYGAAIGNALGSAFEFVRASDIERAVGEPFVWNYRAALPGSLPLYPRKSGFATDDTAMALSVARTIAGERPATADGFAEGFLTDLALGSGRYAEMFWNGGPGGATTRALHRLQRGADPATCGKLEDGGNGTAMRAHPVGFLPDRDEVLSVAAIQARVTHGHPGAITAAQVVAVLVWDALAGREPSDSLPGGIDEPTFAKAWDDAHRDLSNQERLPAHLCNAAISAWATVATAHAITPFHARDPQRAIAAAVASGGDTDTIGCIVGARNGAAGLKKEWLTDLRDRDGVADVVQLVTKRRQSREPERSNKRFSPIAD